MLAAHVPKLVYVDKCIIISSIHYSTCYIIVLLNFASFSTFASVNRGAPPYPSSQAQNCAKYQNSFRNLGGSGFRSKFRAIWGVGANCENFAKSHALFRLRNSGIPTFTLTSYIHHKTYDYTAEVRAGRSIVTCAPLSGCLRCAAQSASRLQIWSAQPGDANILNKMSVCMSGVCM